MDFIEFLRKIEPEMWGVRATSKWTVKDVVAHMVGWEKESVKTLREFKENGTDNPWFMKKDADYTEFNDGAVLFYSEYSPEQLLAEWEKLQNELEMLIKNIGEDILRARPDMEWVFDESKDGHEGHYEHHLKQIKEAIK